MPRHIDHKLDTWKDDQFWGKGILRISYVAREVAQKGAQHLYMT
jgi:hypothetical protein